MAVLADVGDTSLLHVVPWTGCHVATASPPCPPWSRASSLDGLEVPAGVCFLETMLWARRAAPLALLMECVDALPVHPYYPIILAFIRWAGFTVHTTMLHNHAVCGPCTRRRWLAVLIRHDVDMPPSQPVGLFQDPSLGRMSSWRGAIHPTPLANCNGIAQGCSLSVLAANVLMAAWALLIRHFPGVEPRVYVDDGYMSVSSPDAIPSLVQAVRASPVHHACALCDHSACASTWTCVALRMLGLLQLLGSGLPSGPSGCCPSPPLPKPPLLLARPCPCLPTLRNSMSSPVGSCPPQPLRSRGSAGRSTWLAFP